MRWASIRLYGFFMPGKYPKKYVSTGEYLDRMDFSGGEWDVTMLREGSVENVKKRPVHCFFLRINQFYGLLPLKAGALYPADTS